jgi:tRNA(Ile)-lysidine synthase
MKIINPIPRKIYLAISGGVDSMVMRNFLIQGRRDVKYLFMHHGTDNSQKAYDFLLGVIPELVVGNLSLTRKKNESSEMYWRRERYSFLDRFTDRPIITCHHLDDQVENWFMSCSKGNPKVMPYKRDNYIRPMILVKKSEILNYATKNGVVNVEDSSNDDVVHPRNRIRHNVIPEIIKAFPGIYKTVAKKVEENINLSLNE